MIGTFIPFWIAKHKKRLHLIRVCNHLRWSRNSCWMDVVAVSLLAKRNNSFFKYFKSLYKQEDYRSLGPNFRKLVLNDFESFDQKVELMDDISFYNGFKSNIHEEAFLFLQHIFTRKDPTFEKYVVFNVKGLAHCLKYIEKSYPFVVIQNFQIPGCFHKDMIKNFAVEDYEYEFLSGYMHKNNHWTTLISNCKNLVEIDIFKVSHKSFFNINELKKGKTINTAIFVRKKKRNESPLDCYERAINS